MTDTVLLKNAIYKAFPGIAEDEVLNLIQEGVVNEYPGRKDLCIEGNEEDVFYILLDGTVEVTKKINTVDKRRLNELHPGDFFGEMGLIHEAPRAATVTTLGPTTVLEIDKKSFSDVLYQSGTVSLAMVREVSRRLRDNDEMAIEDLRQKAGELANAYQKLAELEVARREFLTTIAHELRTPLTSASGFLQLIQTRKLDENSENQAMEAVRSNLQRIITLTNDFLFLQEMDLIFSEFEEVDIKKVVEKVVEAEKNFAAQMGVLIVVEGDTDDLPQVFGDAESLERSFLALINNAVKFSLNGGLVRIRISLESDFEVISIQDEGIGIAPENLHNIFDRFWRTESYEGHLFDGVGLGLSIAQQVIEQHGGKIEVHSLIDSGSEFSIYLPVINQA
ncbi:cyclic nucleotide-binding domain-containing protein [bacterium]|nr:cyclic nucleotide-binding domain-containing protein [bacterium]